MIYPFPTKGSAMAKKESYGTNNASSNSSNTPSSTPYIETDSSTVRSESVYDWMS
jgi:hypothetical protein